MAFGWDEDGKVRDVDVDVDVEGRGERGRGLRVVDGRGRVLFGGGG